MRRWSVLLVAVLGIVILGGIAFAIGNDGDWNGWDRRHDGEITRVVGTNGEDTIVIREGRPFFFPVGFLFIPLFFLFFFGLMRAIFWRGRGGPWGGPGWRYGPGGPGFGPHGPDSGATPPWFDEWHRRAHEGSTNRQTASGTGDSTATGTPADHP